jgi:hypothetical protein
MSPNQRLERPARRGLWRAAHPSPLDDPSLNREMLEHIPDPSVAKDLEESDRTRRHVIKEMLQRYGQ